MGRERVEQLLSEAVRQGIGSGFAASFGRIDELRNGVSPEEIYLGTTGHGPRGEPVDPETFFDLASLTKILGTTLLAMIRVDRGDLSLETVLGPLFPEWVARHPAGSAISVRELLTHTSGLPAWVPFFEQMRERFGSAVDLKLLPREIRRSSFDSFLEEVGPDPQSRGKVMYSDLGFLWLERVLSSDLERDLAPVFERKDGLRLHFRPLGQTRTERVMMTEDCPWRGLLQGEVHDDNAWSRGGVAGHAGLFGRLRDVHHWIEGLFSGLWVSRPTFRLFSTPVEDLAGSRRALGFDVPSTDGSGSTGFWFSPNSIGHLGFTGTSLWMDLESGVFAVLLSNRVHPRRSDDRIRQLRRDFHEAVRS